MIRAALALVLLTASPVLAADQKWTPAPVPGIGAGDTIQPAARAGDSIGNSHDAPFSAIGSGSIAADGTTSSNRVNGIDTPNLSPQ